MDQAVKDEHEQSTSTKPKPPGEPPIITVSRKNPEFKDGDDLRNKYVQDMALWKKTDKEGKEHFEGFVRNAAGEKQQIVAFFRKDAGAPAGEGNGVIPVLTIKEDVKKGEEGKFVGSAWPVNSRADGSTADVDFSTLYVRFDEAGFKPNDKGVVYAHVWDGHDKFGFNEPPRPADAKPGPAPLEGEVLPPENTPAQPARTSGGPGR